MRISFHCLTNLMKKIFSIPIVVLSIIALIIAILFFLINKSSTPEKVIIVPPALPKVTYTNANLDTIVVASPLPGSTVPRTFSITGRARGSWYFEASFPVSVVDEKGAVIATSAAKAESDWMTTDFVPFKADITIPENVTGKATLILKNDNPSGLPDKDKAVSLPIIITH